MKSAMVFKSCVATAYLVTAIIFASPTRAQGPIDSPKLAGKLVMFPLTPRHTPASVPLLMDLSTGFVRPEPALGGTAAFWLPALAYDPRQEIVHFVEASDRALGKLDLNSPSSKSTKRDIKGADTCFFGEPIDRISVAPKVTLARAYPRDSLLVQRTAEADGTLMDHYVPTLSGGISHLSAAQEAGLVYCILYSERVFHITGIGSPDSMHTRLEPVEDSAGGYFFPHVRRPLVRLIAVDSTGEVRSSRRLRPVIYIGMDVSVDGQWCALSEPVGPGTEEEPETELVLLNLQTDSVFFPDIGQDISLVGPVFSPDGRYLAACGFERDGPLVGVYLAPGPFFDDFRLLYEFYEGLPVALTWSPASDYILMGVKSSVTSRVLQQLQAVELSTGRVVVIPAAKLPSGETLLLSEYQQYTWIR